MKQIMWAIGLAILLWAGTILPAEAAGGGGFHGGGSSMGGGGFRGGSAGAFHAGGSFHGGHFHGGTRVFIGGGFGWWGWPGWWGPSYPYYGYYGASPVVVQQGPAEYIRQDSSTPSAPQYWYYCQEAGAYYPYVKECPSRWMQVVPQPVSPGR